MIEQILSSENILIYCFLFCYVIMNLIALTRDKKVNQEFFLLNNLMVYGTLIYLLAH